MLTPEYMKKLPNWLLNHYMYLEFEILYDVADKLSRFNTLDKEKLQTTLLRGYDLREVEKQLQLFTQKTEDEVRKVVEDAGLVSYENDLKAYKLANKTLPDIDDNMAVLRFMEAAQYGAIEDVRNITNSLGLAGKPLQEFYTSELSKAVVKIQSGAFSSQDVIKQVIKAVTDKGLQYIDYRSGRRISVESAARTAIMSSVNRLSATMSLMNAHDMQQDLMQLTAHSGARPTHADWQGRIVSLSGRKGYLNLGDIEYGQVTGFLGANCRHNWYPFFEDVSVNIWSDEELENIDPPPIEYKGKEYTRYDATQKQREIERSIRNSKKKILMYDKTGLQNDKINEQIRLRRKQAFYDDFTKAANLKSQEYRAEVYKYDDLFK